MDIAVLHYSAPPVVGGVEAVINAHTRLLLEAGCRVTIIAGDGEKQALPPGAEWVRIPEMSTGHPLVLQASQVLEKGRQPASFQELSTLLEEQLAPLLRPAECVIVHNLFTKHFNLPLTAALFRLLNQGLLRHCIAWCHDFTWTSASSRSKVYPGLPWDLLRTYRPDVTYVVVSHRRQSELAELLGCSEDRIHVVYNGVDPQDLLGLSAEGSALSARLDLWDSDLVLLMPVRVTRAKHIELALQVVAALKARGVRPRLVVTGPPDPHDPQAMDYFQSLLALRQELGVERELRFVYESGPQPGVPYQVSMSLVRELFQLSDALFMPSLREGFGMPILEAGLLGLPIFCTPIPAAQEIGGEDVVMFSPDTPPPQVANLLLDWAEASPVHRLRRRVRQDYTWPAIFRREILPLLAVQGAG